MTVIRKVYRYLVIKIYRPYLKRLSLFESLAFILKYRFAPYLIGRGDRSYKCPSWKVTGFGSGKVKKVAIICDEMTWQNFQGEFELVFLTPQNWYSVLEEFRPDLFFCESAWHGNQDHYGCWDYRIIHNRRLLTENRIALIRILNYCNKAGVPTVFWNKEDPVFFYDEVNNFVDTALMFDHIFTTAAECVPLYCSKGHKSVHEMMFGFSTRLFYPIKNFQPNDTAAFFGGWYTDQPQRCRDMEKTFDMALAYGLKLVIYDRYWGTNEENNLFPEKYKRYLKKGINYKEIRSELKNIQYVININTVKDSDTMFARRVFEMMACGKVIISNYSKGMERIFGDRVWFTDKPFHLERAEQIIEENIKNVITNHAWSKRLDEMLKVIDLQR